MLRSILALAAFVVAPSVALAQNDWRQMMTEDAVSLQDGKWIIEEYSMERISIDGYEPAEFQLRLHSEAPAASVMSRDFFVRTTFEMQVGLLLTVLAGAYQTTPAQFLAGHESKPLRAPIGQADVEINLIMTAEGMQVEWKDNTTGQASRQTMVWAEVIGA